MIFYLNKGNYNAIKKNKDSEVTDRSTTKIVYQSYCFNLYVVSIIHDGSRGGSRKKGDPNHEVVNIYGKICTVQSLSPSGAL